MVHAMLRDVKPTALVFHISVHAGDRSRFCIIRADMQALYAQALFIGPKLRLGEIRLLFAGGLLNRPVKVSLRHKIRQPDG